MAWDRLSPVASSALSSSPVRSNFQAVDQSNLGPNWIPDPHFLVWAGGDSVLPSYWTNLLGGGGTLIARDTTDYRTNGMACKMTVGTTDIHLQQTLLPAGTLPSFYQGQTVSFGVWCKTSTADMAAAQIFDTFGATQTPAHSGGGGWEWLSATHTFNASANMLDFRLRLLGAAGAGATATFDLPTVIPGPIPPQDFLPGIAKEGVLYFPFNGTVSTGIALARFISNKPFIVTNTTLNTITAPTGASLIVDVNHFDGAAYQTMHATKPTIAISGTGGGADPDGTYRYRCFKGAENTGSITDALLGVDIDQVGSTVAGSDLIVLVRVLSFESPAYALLA